MAPFITLRISTAILAFIAGILVLAFPKALRIFVGFYLLLIGILGILDSTLT